MNYRKRKRIIRRRKIAAVFVMIVLLVGSVWFAYVSYMAENYNDPLQTTSAPTSSYVAPNIQVFRSPYFQFQTNRTWSEDAAASTANRFAYRSMRGNLLEHTLLVYVNSSPDDLKASRVLTATLNGNRGLAPGKVSAQCGKTTGNTRGTGSMMILEQVSFRCFGDVSTFSVLVGMPGGTPEIKLPRPDGSTASYTIYYSNVTDAPDAAQLIEILNSFQTR